MTSRVSYFARGPFPLFLWACHVASMPLAVAAAFSKALCIHGMFHEE
jgi:hypothetical protein